MGDFLSTQFLRIYKTHEFQNLHITNIIINISALEMFYDNCLYKSILHYSTLLYCGMWMPICFLIFGIFQKKMIFW